MAQSMGSENRLLAALGYPIWVVALIVLLTDLKQNPFMRLHAVQALGYTIAWVVVAIGLGILTSLPGLWTLGFLVPLGYLAWFVLALFYAYRAYQGETFRIPVVSDVTARYTGSGS